MDLYIYLKDIANTERSYSVWLAISSLANLSAAGPAEETSLKKVVAYYFA